MKQAQRKPSKNLDCWKWNGFVFAKAVPNWVRGMCRVARPSGGYMLLVETTTGVQRCYKPCWVVRNHGNYGAIAVSNEEFEREYFEVII